MACHLTAFTPSSPLSPSHHRCPPLRTTPRTAICGLRMTAADPSATPAPLLIRAARRQPVPRPPVWLMRQAGRYMAAFREFSNVHPFRHRSESPDIAVELSLQPYHAFAVDAVIMFSDILTPLPALGVDFDVVSGKGPIIPSPLRTPSAISNFLSFPFDPKSSLSFVSEILSTLRAKISSDPDVALLGFVGAPFTLAAYMIEGKGVKNLTHVKRFIYGDKPQLDAQALHNILDHLAETLAQYSVFQIDAGAHAVQLFDSWAHHLSPAQYAEFALPYAVKVARLVKNLRPDAAIIFFANGSAGKLEDINQHMTPYADVIGIDWSVRMSDARRIFGDNITLQGNVDPCILTVGSEEAIRRAVRDTVSEAGENLILNLGHGVIKETPESAVEVLVNEVKSLAFTHAT